ncbi:hypothetical protein AGLY_005979 [Aphis glycines]|uniref:Uncharacterized protein n=1 Tax=Aphis glycines TaxID=307491 RepID=A0A6G0TSW3_APHGL|nr:hypothetical protein AGLY_005979 [Aphis glycines]
MMPLRPPRSEHAYANNLVGIIGFDGFLHIQTYESYSCLTGIRSQKKSKPNNSLFSIHKPAKNRETTLVYTGGISTRIPIATADRSVEFANGLHLEHNQIINFFKITLFNNAHAPMTYAPTIDGVTRLAYTLCPSDTIRDEIKCDILSRSGSRRSVDGQISTSKASCCEYNAYNKQSTTTRYCSSVQ